MRDLKPSLLLVIVFLSNHLAAAPAWTDVWVASDADNVWIAVAEAERRLIVLHRHGGDESYHVRRAAGMSGRLAPAGMAAAGGQLWLVYDDLTLQSLIRREPQLPMDSIFDVPRLRGSLPQGVTLRALSANREGPWALVRVDTAESLARLLAATEAAAPPSMLPWVEEPDADGFAIVPAPQQPVATDATSDVDPAFQPVDRLLRWHQRRWKIVELPQGWSPDDPAWLLMMRETDLAPVLVTMQGGADQPTILAYRQNGSGGADSSWRRSAYVLPPADAQTLVPLAVQGQLIAGRQLRSADVEVELTLLRREAVTVLGRLHVEAPAAGLWQLLAEREHAVMIHVDEENRITWTSIDLRGQVVQQPEILHVDKAPPVGLNPGQIITVAAVSILIVFLFWRRDPVRNRLELPRHLVLADHPRRILALCIDLAPGLMVAAWLTDTSFEQMAHGWPNLATTWPALIPGALASGLTILHVTVLEVFAGRSLGKMFLGLRVVTMDGRDPNVWQVLGRNLLKTLDLLVFLLPLVVLVGPYRQRLGDMVAGTVVVSRGEAPPELPPQE